MINVKIKPIHPDFKMPKQMTDGAAGFDVCAMNGEVIDLSDGKVHKVPLGFTLEIPEGYEAQLRMRSGLAAKGAILANGVGTIDSDYRGEVCALLHYTDHLNSNGFHVHTFDRVGQLVIQKLPEVQFELADELSETERGEGGFGSTGR